MIIKRTERSAVEISQVKKAYKTPTMKCFGTVRELTQAGGSTANENFSPSGCSDDTRRTNVNCTQ
jgi:hypothetical protein